MHIMDADNLVHFSDFYKISRISRVHIIADTDAYIKTGIFCDLD